MKKLILFALAFCFILPLSAQIKVISFKKLQPFLPAKEIEGFKRNKPTGETQTVMGFSTSQASVNYEKLQKETDTAFVQVSYKFTIQDVILYPIMLAQFNMYQQNYERETETGYEKAYALKDKFPGKISVNSSDYKSCKIEAGIGNRFYITGECDGSDDVKLLESLLLTIDFDKLILVESDK
ncbi:MAG: hypothetical protein HYV28_16730 [Ignavibacteriales bacterium]|nr:hypothetical protein [Ignavibacteriales bacterium]